MAYLTLKNNPNSRLEKIFDDAQHSGELQIVNRSLKKYPELHKKYDLVDVLSVDLTNNRFTEIPDEIFKLRSLESLNVSRNIIKSITNSRICSLVNLTYLNLNRNLLTYLPPEISELVNLEVLLVSNNRLISLPEEICTSLKLAKLDASRNELTQIPIELGQMTSLHCLNLSQNSLIEIPTSLSCLNLRYLDISSNQIGSLPVELGRMEGVLEELYVHDNPLISPPAKICSRGMVFVLKTLNRERLKIEKRKSFMQQNSNNINNNNINIINNNVNNIPDLISNKVKLRTHSTTSNDSYNEVAKESLHNNINSTLSPSIQKNSNRAVPTPVKSGFSQNELQQLKLSLTNNNSNNNNSNENSINSGNKNAVYSANTASTSSTKNITKNSSLTRNNNNVGANNNNVGANNNNNNSGISSSIRGLEQLTLDLENLQPGFTVKRSLMHARDDKLVVDSMRKALESKLKITLPSNLDGCLKDGVVLCHFVNELFPGTISLVYVPRTENAVLSVTRCRSNIDFFINACYRLGLEKSRVCSLADILGGNLPTVAKTVLLLIETQQQQRNTSTTSTTSTC